MPPLGGHLCCEPNALRRPGVGGGAGRLLSEPVFPAPPLGRIAPSASRPLEVLYLTAKQQQPLRGECGSYRWWGISPIEKPDSYRSLESYRHTHSTTHTTQHILWCGKNPLEKPSYETQLDLSDLSHCRTSYDTCGMMTCRPWHTNCEVILRCLIRISDSTYFVNASAGLIVPGIL